MCMAKVTVKLPEDFLLKVSKLGGQTDRIIESCLEAGSEVVLSKVRSNLNSVIGSGTKYPSEATGELASSLGVTPAKLDRDGNHNVKIGFNEPRRRQYAAKGKRSYYTITNAMIANVIEHGKHGQPAKPFLKPARTSSRKACIEAIKRKLDEEIEKI
nr:MAG TPA: type I neck protein [Caudoviricetes sp.]